MKRLFLPLLICCLVMACNQNEKKPAEAAAVVANNKELAEMFKLFHEDFLRLNPLSATVEGDARYNDQLPLDFTDAYRDKLKSFYQSYLGELKKFNRDSLNESDKLSYDIFEYTMNINIESFQFPDNYMPFNQYSGMHLIMGQFASGSSAQPFKTVKDYDNWMARVKLFRVYADSSIVYFRRGMAANIVLPRS